MYGLLQAISRYARNSTVGPQEIIHILHVRWGSRHSLCFVVFVDTEAQIVSKRLVLIWLCSGGQDWRTQCARCDWLFLWVQPANRPKRTVRIETLEQELAVSLDRRKNTLTLLSCSVVDVMTRLPMAVSAAWVMTPHVMTFHQALVMRSFSATHTNVFCTFLGSVCFVFCCSPSAHCSSRVFCVLKIGAQLSTEH